MEQLTMNQNQATEFLKNYQFIAALRTALPTKLRSDEIDRYLADLLRDGSFTPEELEEARKTRRHLVMKQIRFGILPIG